MKSLILQVLIIGFLFTNNQVSQAQSNLKTQGEVFYHNTFDWGNPDNPQGWKAEEGFSFEDPKDNGFNWHWYPNDSLISQYVYEPPFRSSSPDDGHLCLFLSKYNEYKEPLFDINNKVDNSIVFPAFDCSDRSSVVVSFETNFMAYGSAREMEMMISNDYGMRWAFWELGFGAWHKERPKGVGPGEAALYEANISHVAAGRPHVIIKIRWYDTYAYYWLIDDFKLSEGLDNDLRIEYHRLEWDDGNENTRESYSYNLPITQVGGSLTNFEAAIRNFGLNDQNDVQLEIDISKNNQSIWKRSTDPYTIYFIEKDTLFLSEAFTPTEFGHYKASYNLKQKEEEQFPDDNYAEVCFNITDSIYSRGRDIPNEKFMYGFYRPGEEGEPNEQMFLGSLFPIYGDVELNSISVYVTGGLADGLIEFRAALYWEPPQIGLEIPIPELFLTSDMVTLDSSMFNSWVTLPLIKDGESEFLKAGNLYYGGVEYWNYHTANIPYKKYQNFEIGANRGIRMKDPPNRARYNPDIDIFRKFDFPKDQVFMVRMNLNDHSNIIDGNAIQSSISELGQNYPNPARDFTKLDFELSNSANVSIKITDYTGRTVAIINKGFVAAGKHLTTVNTENWEAGIYFYTLTAGGFIETKSMTVIN